jgi:heptosyltransferase-2
MNVAVFLPNWVGDAVMATPALRALRAHFRGARLLGVARPNVAGVLEGGDWFDGIVPAGKGGLRGLLGTARLLRRGGVGLAVLMTNSYRTFLAAWLGRCRRRVGFARYPAASLLLTDALRPVRDAAGRLKPSPVLDDYNRLAERAGCPPPGRRMELFTTPADEAAADQVWERAGFAGAPEVVCLNPGAAFGPAKQWPAEHFAALARDLADRRGSGVLVLCGPSERELARRIARAAGRRSVHALADLGVPPSLGLTKACVRRCGLLVTTDSGPRHFAAAFGRPVVTLFGPTHVAWTETYYPRAVHLQKKVDCGPCQRRVCPLDHRCMTGLTPAEVYAAAEALLRGGAGSPCVA